MCGFIILFAIFVICPVLNYHITSLLPREYAKKRLILNAPSSPKTNGVRSFVFYYRLGTIFFVNTSP